MFLFLPGFLCNQRIFHNQIRAFQGQVANYGIDDTINKMAHTAVSQVQDINIKYIVAFSMGGYVALEIMKQKLLQPKGLIIINSTHRKSSDNTQTESLIRKYQDDVSKYRLNRMYMDSAFYNHTEDDYQLLSTMNQEVVQQGALIPQCKALISRSAYTDILPSIKIKTLIITSLNDKIVDNIGSFEMVKLIPNATISVMEYSGHFSLIEEHFKVNQSIRSIID